MFFRRLLQEQSIFQMHNLQMDEMCLPEHRTPSPVKPFIHTQLKDPGKLWQVARLEQLCRPLDEHSSISIKKKSMLFPKSFLQ